MTKRGAANGFTLLEVMVAMAILAIALSAVFSTEAGSIRMAARARKMGFATLLVRCKMGEIEEEIATNGLPAIFASGNDACCEDAEIDGFECKWEIEPILMPDTMFEEPDADAVAPGTAPGASPPAPGAAATDSLSGDPSELLSGGGDVGGMASMAMQYVYPVLKPAFESQVRRATVTVTWHEGTTARSFEVTQYLVAEQGAAPATDPNDPAQGAGGLGTPPATGGALFNGQGQTQP
jgi:general secretion pathway protein I